MATDGISGMAKAAIDAANQAKSNPITIILVIVGLYLVYAWMVKKWPFKK